MRVVRNMFFTHTSLKNTLNSRQISKSDYSRQNNTSSRSAKLSNKQLSKGIRFIYIYILCCTYKILVHSCINPIACNTHIHLIINAAVSFESLILNQSCRGTDDLIKHQAFGMTFDGM